MGADGIKNNSGPRRTGRIAVLAVLLLAFFVILTPRPARACFFPCDFERNRAQSRILNAYIKAMHSRTRLIVDTHTDTEFIRHHNWMEGNDFWTKKLGKALMLMTEQFSAVAMQQMEVVGAFLDAKHQLETQRLFGQLAAQAHKDYHPSEGLCTIGTAARNLPGAERNGELAALVLSRRSQDRQLMNVNTSGSEGALPDVRMRVLQFRSNYCDPNDNNRNLAKICDGTSVQAERKNKDVDFGNTLFRPLTLSIDFSSAAASADKTDLLTLQSNLYAHRLFTLPFAASSLVFDSADIPRDRNRSDAYMNLRSIIAKRSVAENSFQAIAAMKVAGSPPETAKYLQAAVQQLNSSITADQAVKMIGANPSYDAQMEVLTKKIFENPQFFTDLYDKPANVARKGVAIDALMTIQDRDEYKSTLRMESMLSLLLELKLQIEQDTLQNRIDPMVQQ